MTPKNEQIIIAGMMTGKKYICASCQKEIKGFRDRPSAREFAITHLCQSCQDKVWGSEKTKS